MQPHPLNRTIRVARASPALHAEPEVRSIGCARARLPAALAARMGVRSGAIVLVAARAAGHQADRDGVMAHRCRGDLALHLCRIVPDASLPPHTLQFQPSVTCAGDVGDDALGLLEAQLAHAPSAAIVLPVRPAPGPCASVQVSLLAHDSGHLHRLRKLDARQLVACVKEACVGLPVHEQCAAAVTCCGAACQVTIASTVPSGAVVVIGPATRLLLLHVGLRSSSSGTSTTPPATLPATLPSSPLTPTTLPAGAPASEDETTLALVPGLAQARDVLREMLLLPVQARQATARLRIRLGKAALLTGPPGVGKTTLVRQLAAECARLVPLRLFCLDGAALYAAAGGGVGDAEHALRAAFQSAAQHAAETEGRGASLIFIDEIDALCPRRQDAGGSEARMVAQLLTLMDGLRQQQHVVVAAATNRPHALDPALRRPGRFDREIEFPPPQAQARLSILRAHTRRLPLAPSAADSLPALAERCVGCVGADLAAVAREAAMRAVFRCGTAAGAAADARVVVEAEDLEHACGVVGASALRGSEVQRAGTRWENVGGQAEAKLRLRQAVEWPLLHPHAFQRLGLRPPRGVLLFGPPGCSKTTLVRAAANATHAAFLSLSGADVFSPFVGDAERAVRDAFRRAREAQPALLFLDEVDTLVGRREVPDAADGSSEVQQRVLSTLLNEMDGVQAAGALLVVGATNRPWAIDAALLRPGRFDQLVYVPLPDEPARQHILHIHTHGVPLHAAVDLDAVARAAAGATGAELESVCREAALLCLRELGPTAPAPKVQQRHLMAALAEVQRGRAAEVDTAAFERFMATR